MPPRQQETTSTPRPCEPFGMLSQYECFEGPKGPKPWAPTLLANLVAALVLSCSTCPAAAVGAQLSRSAVAGRSLRQTGTGNTAASSALDGAAVPPGAEPSAPAHDACQAAVQSMLDGCPISLDRIAITYSRGSTGPPTQAELEAAVADLAAAGLPPAK